MLAGVATSSAQTYSTAAHSAIDWGSIISQGIASTPAIISAAKGQPYASPGYPTIDGGGGVSASGYVPGLGGGAFGLSTTTLLLIGVGLFLLMGRR